MIRVTREDCGRYEQDGMFVLGILAPDQYSIHIHDRDILYDYVRYRKWFCFIHGVRCDAAPAAATFTVSITFHVSGTRVIFGLTSEPRETPLM